MNHPIAIIADDLTGALDSAVAFSALGSSVTLFPVDDGDGDGDGEGDGDDDDRDRARASASASAKAVNSASEQTSYAVAVSTASRALTAAEAHNRAREAASALSNSDTLFVKVDSTLRGNPAAHLDGALDAWRTNAPRAFAVICPALPIMGRTMHGGEVLDHSVPITRSAAANDPLASAPSATITDIFSGARFLDATTISAAGGLAAALMQHDRDAQPGIPRNVCVDASTDADLDAIADALIFPGRNAVAVGSAGLAAAIARRALRSRTAIPAAAPAPTPTPAAAAPAPAPAPAPASGAASSPATLVFLTSLHPAARQQLAMVQTTHADVTVHLDGAALSLTSSIPPTAPSAQRIVVVTTADRDPSTVKVDEALAATIANRSALLAATLLRTGDFSSLLIIGGDGASALLRELGAGSIRITGELLAGVPVGILRGGEAHGISVATRSGGFGHDHHLNDILATLHQTPPQPTHRPTHLPTQPQPKDPA